MRLADSPGRSHEGPGNRLPREMTTQIQNPAYRPPTKTTAVQREAIHTAPFSFRGQ